MPVREATNILNASEKLLVSGRVAEGMDLLMNGLRQLKSQLPAAQWESVSNATREHPIAELVHQDPFTRRAFHKPRGYAGDAPLIDFLYYHEASKQAIRSATPLGKEICHYMCSCPSGKSVRWRQRYFAKQIDQTIEKCELARTQADIMAVACGHLRELQNLERIESPTLQRIVAFDQDHASLSEVESLNHPKILPICDRVSSLLRGKIDVGVFDLIYAAGLYDYLPDEAAIALTQELENRLKPGGRLILANFLPDNYEGGYMDSLMAWKLIYREMHEFSRLLNMSLKKSTVWPFRDIENHIGYFEIIRNR